MNEELQQALADIILKATETAGAAKDFVLAEMPDVIHQLLMWKATMSFIAFLVSLALFTAWLWLPKFFAPVLYDDEDRFMCRAIGGALMGFIGAMTLFSSGLTWLQILIAPKIYLIEYAASLVK